MLSTIIETVSHRPPHFNLRNTSLISPMAILVLMWVGIDASKQRHKNLSDEPTCQLSDAEQGFHPMLSLP
jgi:hypothetical protein